VPEERKTLLVTSIFECRHCAGHRVLSPHKNRHVADCRRGALYDLHVAIEERDFSCRDLHRRSRSGAACRWKSVSRRDCFSLPCSSAGTDPATTAEGDQQPTTKTNFDRLSFMTGPALRCPLYGWRTFDWTQLVREGLPRPLSVILAMRNIRRFLAVLATGSFVSMLRPDVQCADLKAASMLC